VPGKRQHYVPRLLLRRFSIDPSDKKSHVWRLDKRTGQPLRVNPVNEVVVGHYYRMTFDDGTVDDTADETLDRIEGLAATVIANLADASYPVNGGDFYALLLFIVSLRNRTPQAREALREMDEQAHELMLEVTLANKDEYHRSMRESGQTVAEVEAGRLKMLADLGTGRLRIGSTPDREIPLMFMALQQTVDTLVTAVDCLCVRIPEASSASFVISDHPVAHYDPTPKTPESGGGFISSPNTRTWIPLDPKFGLILVQKQPAPWQNVAADGKDVDELNLLTYAWAREAVYGPSQHAVARVRQLAKANRPLMAEFRYRPPRVWISDRRDAGRGAGPHRFTSRFKGESVTRTMYVSPEAFADQQGPVWPPPEGNLNDRPRR
jgi:Protein of unknown function (DUF4238)